MKIKITPRAKKVLDEKLGGATTLLLTLDDGSNNFSSAGGTCTIGDRFQFVARDAVEPFTIPVENDDYTIFTSDYELRFLGQHPVLDTHEHYPKLLFKNESGMLDSNFKVVVPVQA